MSADRAEEIIFDCPMILNTAMEYEDAHTKIIGGRLPILPSVSGINIQAAIRDADGECRVTIGYPALPLESY